MKRVMRIFSLALIAVLAATGCASQPSAAPEMRVSGGYVQWRAGDSEWQNLMALDTPAEDPAASLGEPGAAGQNGREIEIRNNGKHIQWRYAGDTAWNNLAALSDLAGATGLPGAAGTPGAAGAPGPAGAAGSDGAAGREVEIQNSGTHIQWRYAGDTAWNDLAALADLTGPAGPAGAAGAAGATGAAGSNGADGREIEMRNSGTHLQWRYAGDTAWNDLAALADLTGPAGTAGAPGATGAAGADGADSAILARAQYRFTGINSASFYLELGPHIASTDAALISLSDDRNIALAAGHSYLVSYSLTTFLDGTPFTMVMNPNFNYASIISQTDVAGQIGSTGSYASCLYGTFLVDGGASGGNLSFSCTYFGGVEPSISTSTVTVLCIQ